MNLIWLKKHIFSEILTMNYWHGVKLPTGRRFFCAGQGKWVNAQVDYLIQQGEHIAPIEVKAGTQGAMQSLRLFMSKKNITKGIRTSLENFAQYENIEVFPLYAISNLLKNR